MAGKGDYRTYQLLLANHGARALLGAFVAQPAALTSDINVVRLLFDPRLVRPFVDNWEAVARALVARLHRESLLAPHDQELNDLLQSLFGYEGVPQDFRHPDVTEPISEALTVRLKRGPLQLSLLSTITVFSAPHNITLEDLRVESYFPTDDDSAETCRTLTLAESELP